MAERGSELELQEFLQRVVEDHLQAAYRLCEEARRALDRKIISEAIAKAWSAVLHATAALVTAKSGKPCSPSDVVHGEPVSSIFAKMCPARAEGLREIFRSVRDSYCDIIYNGWIDGEQDQIVQKAGEYLTRVRELVELPSAR